MELHRASCVDGHRFNFLSSLMEIILLIGTVIGCGLMLAAPMATKPSIRVTRSRTRNRSNLWARFPLRPCSAE